MSVSVRVTREQLVPLLEWLVRELDYAWDAHADLFRIEHDKNKQVTAVVAHLETLERDELAEFERLAGAVKVVKWAQASGDLRLSAFVERLAVQREHTPRRTRDLLVAGYELDGAAFRALYVSAPKNHDAPDSRAFFFERKPQEPSFVFTLPQAPADHDWLDWLDSARALHGKEHERVRLFRKLPGPANAELFIEYGFAHPLEHLLPSLLIEDETSALCLIPGGGQRWSRLDAKDEHLLWNSPTQVPITLDGAKAQAEARRSEVPMTIEWKLELAPVAVEQRDRLASLEQRIQGIREHLSELELERRALLSHRRDRFRFLLRFEQSEEQVPPRLSWKLERFLFAAQRHLERFTYDYVEEEPQPEEPEPKQTARRFHVLTSTVPMLREEVELGWADEVYCQPDWWADHKLWAFVADGSDLRPRIDQQMHARRLSEELKGLVPKVDERHPVLLRPGAEGATLRWQELDLAEKACTLRDAVEHLGAHFPGGAHAAQLGEVASLRTEIARLGQSAHASIATLEKELVDDSDRRMAQVSEWWNPLARELDTTAAGVAIAASETELVREKLRATEKTWLAIVDAVVGAHERVLAPKLAALAKLAQAKPELDRRIEEAAQANIDVGARLEELRASLDPLLEDAQRRHGEAQIELEKTRLKHAEVAPQVEHLRGEIAAMEDRAQGLADQVEQRTRDADAKLTRLSALLDELRRLNDALAQRLERLLNGLADAQARRKHAEEQVAALQRTSIELDRCLDEAARANQRADQEQHAVETKARDVAVQVDDHRRRLGELRALAENSANAVRKTMDGADRERNEVNEQLAKLQHETQALTNARVRLAELRRHAEFKQEQRDAEVQQYLEAAAEVERWMGNADGETRAATDKLLKRVNDLVADLKLLSQLERNFTKLGDPPSRIGAHARLFKETELRPLSAEERAALWGNGTAGTTAGGKAK